MFPVIFGGFLWFPVVFCGFLWLYVALCCLRWFSIVFCGFLWFPAVFFGYLWFSGFLWFSAVSGCLVFSKDLYCFLCFLWFSVVSCGFMWLSVLFCGLLWFSAVVCFLLCAVINALLDKRKGREGVNIFSHLFRLPRKFNHETTKFHQNVWGGTPKLEREGIDFKPD